MKTDMHGSWINEGLLQPLLVLDKRSRSIGSKSKRLLMDNDDAMELQLTWEEAQDLLRPPPRVKPSVVIIEDQEFEEYEEPPVLGKRTFFTAQPSGGLDQWIQCDDCLKWRRIPGEVLPPSKWACVDNNWDPKRSSCAVTDELAPSELQALLLQHAEIKRQRMTSSKASSSEAEPTGIGALGSAAVLGQMGNQNPSTVATTTRHPRHRPGCTCIVCIQPPSGKGPKHSPNCTCNVCMTVKRRFKTLMMRKKKRQFEREEADTDKRSEWVSKEELDGSGSSLPREELVESLDASKGHIDLNRQPQRDAGQQAAGTSTSSQLSMTSLIQIAGHPLENYLKQNKLVSLTASEHQVSSSSATVPQVLMESDSGGDDEHCGSEKIVSSAAAA
ncbi:hypothetical protein HPP92_013404 [Vanilla planifolia]|uniref:CW-type domain-containing protein n=1 Tax=Vanilla planifolia TaxID=51239 RepID=A0A835QS75_VANPL|nr:hypothetical protein HPP92_013404 [Vanilla planifolia]